MGTRWYGSTPPSHGGRPGGSSSSWQRLSSQIGSLIPSLRDTPGGFLYLSILWPVISRWSALVVAALLLGACAPGTATSNALVLGVLLPLSGPAAAAAREDL